MDLFEEVWSLIKDVDFKFPDPLTKPSSIDEDAVLAFRGSKLPSFGHYYPYNERDNINPVTGKEWENPTTDPLTGELWPNPKDFMESIKFDLARRKGEVIEAPTIDYEVGDFDEKMKDNSEGGFLSRWHPDFLYAEIERAGLMRALRDANIMTDEEKMKIYDTWAGFSNDWSNARRMKTDKGWQQYKLGDY
jgi:hypothetical protein